MGYPIAYFITFTTYGTWLHGDRSGSVDRENNKFGTEFIASNIHLMRRRHSSLKDEQFEMKADERDVVLKAILEVCRVRQWIGHAIHVRSNHVHAVVGGKVEPEKVMENFKGYATRALRNSFVEYVEKKKVWTRHGSTKYIWTQEKLASAMNYVKYEQGEPMEFGSTE